MKRLGPELKMPDLKGVKEMKAPAWLADLYYDMRDRRLLPLVALVAVAIAAVPFLLGGTEEEVTPPVAGGPAAGEAAIGAEPTRLTVVEAQPGLRNYKKRLKRRSPSNPFAQKYTSVPPEARLESVGPAGGGGGSAVSVTEATGGGGGGEASPPSSGGSPSTDGSPSPPSRDGGSGAGDLDPTKPGLRFYAFRPDIRFGIAGSGELNEYEKVPAGKVLPKRQPVIVFVGVSEDGRRAGFDISPEVLLVRGGGRCIGGNKSCSLLFLKVGEAATLLTGKPNRSFRLNVTGIDFVQVRRPKPAGKSSRQERIGFGFSVVGQFQK